MSFTIYINHDQDGRLTSDPHVCVAAVFGDITS